MPTLSIGRYVDAKRLIALFTVLTGAFCLEGCGERKHEAKPQRPSVSQTTPQPQEDKPTFKMHVPAAVVTNLNISTRKAEKMHLARELELVGTVEFDQDKYAVASPRLSGLISKIGARLGDVVKPGAILAEIESVELARAAAEYLGVKARAHAAELNAARERDMLQKNATSERSKEISEAEAAALSAQTYAAEHLLLALGLTHDELPDDGRERPLNRYRLRSPIGGLVVERSAILGEAVTPGRPLYKVASLASVWIKLDVYERDLTWVQPGLLVEVRAENIGVLGRASVAYIEPTIDEETRTAKVHLNFDNSKARVRPGQFVTAHLKSEGTGVEVLAVPKASVDSIESKNIVFVKNPDGGFSVREVKLGSMAGEVVEIRDGVYPGDEVASSNVFLLKSEILR